MSQLAKGHHTAKNHTTGGRDGSSRIVSAVSRSPNRRILATAAVAGAFGLMLLASISYAQTVLAANSQASGARPLPAKMPAALDSVLAGCLDGIGGLCDARIIPIAGSSPRKGTSHEVPDFLSHDTDR